jgi:hypothetical protein
VAPVVNDVRATLADPLKIGTVKLFFGAKTVKEVRGMKLSSHIIGTKKTRLKTMGHIYYWATSFPPPFIFFLLTPNNNPMNRALERPSHEHSRMSQLAVMPKLHPRRPSVHNSSASILASICSPTGPKMWSSSAHPGRLLRAHAAKPSRRPRLLCPLWANARK